MPLWTSHVRCRGIPHLIYIGGRRMGNCPQAGEKPLPSVRRSTQLKWVTCPRKLESR